MTKARATRLNREQLLSKPPQYDADNNNHGDGLSQSAVGPKEVYRKTSAVDNKVVRRILFVFTDDSFQTIK